MDWANIVVLRYYVPFYHSSWVRAKSQCPIRSEAMHALNSSFFFFFCS